MAGREGNSGGVLSQIINYPISENIKSLGRIDASCVPSVLVGDGKNVMIWVVSSGNIRLSIGDENYKITSNMMFVLHGGVSATGVRCSKAFKGYLMLVKSEYFTTVNVDTADFIVADMVARTNPIFELETTYSELLISLAEQIIVLSDNNHMALHEKVVTSLAEAFLYVFISVVGNKRMDDALVRRNSSLMVLKRFSELLMEHYMYERNVDYYAAQLGITSKYLSIVCRKYRGVTASHVIDGVVIRQAKMLLKQPGVSIQDVAMQLNFPSQSFFGKYFKQHVGVSPSRYRGHE